MIASKQTFSLHCRSLILAVFCFLYVIKFQIFLIRFCRLMTICVYRNCVRTLRDVCHGSTLVWRLRSSLLTPCYSARYTQTMVTDAPVPEVLQVRWIKAAMREKWSWGFPTRSDTIWPVQLLKTARSLKFQI